MTNTQVNAKRSSCAQCIGTRGGQCSSCHADELGVEATRLRLENDRLRGDLAASQTEIARLRARLTEGAVGIAIRGWWCLACDTFQGEEHSPRDTCRRCGQAKTVRA